MIESNILTASVAPYKSVCDVYSPRLLWPTTNNFPPFDCFYFHSNGEVFPCQMTIAKTHELKDSGATNAKNYFDRLLSKKKPAKYRAILVVRVDLAEAKVHGEREWKACVYWSAF